MDKEMYYNIVVSFHMQVAKWRVDDPTNKDNWEYSLEIYDRNQGRWININDLKRPGEFSYVYDVKLNPVQEVNPPGAPEVLDGE
jgi:hypothetical protein